MPSTSNSPQNSVVTSQVRTSTIYSIIQHIGPIFLKPDLLEMRKSGTPIAKKKTPLKLSSAYTPEAKCCRYIKYGQSYSQEL